MKNHKKYTILFIFSRGAMKTKSSDFLSIIFITNCNLTNNTIHRHLTMRIIGGTASTCTLNHTKIPNLTMKFF